MMRASIIISTYTLKRLSDLKDAVEALSPQVSDDVEVFLIVEDDQVLIDGLTKAFKDTGIKILISKKRGLTHARNLGIERSSGEIVIFLDDDAVPDKNWLKELLKPYDDPRVLAVGGGVIPDWAGSRPKWLPGELDWIIGSFYEGHSKKPAFVRNVIGANMSFRHEVFNEIGMFSTDIGAVGKRRIAGDDSEFCMRLRIHYGPGHILYIPTGQVKHRVPKERQTLGYCHRRAYVEGASKALIEKRFKGESQLDTEKGHLKYLLTKGLPSKLSRPGQFIVLASCTLLVLLGYARGRLVKVKGAI